MLALNYYVELECVTSDISSCLHKVTGTAAAGIAARRLLLLKMLASYECLITFCVHLNGLSMFILAGVNNSVLTNCFSTLSFISLFMLTVLSNTTSLFIAVFSKYY
jgi:hypothetical protein